MTKRGMTCFFVSLEATAMVLVVALPVAAWAQQTSARGMSGNMSLLRLENRLKNLEADNARTHTCTQQGKLYVPGSSRADNNGCVVRGLSGCHVMAGQPRINGSHVDCATDEQIISGGGVCADGNVGYLHFSRPAGNGWTADCFRHDGQGDLLVTPYALCCKK